MCSVWYRPNVCGTPSNCQFMLGVAKAVVLTDGAAEAVDTA
jgi:hypothetical protein